MLIVDEIGYKIRTVRRNKVEQYTIIKGAIKQQHIIILSIYTPNIGRLKDIKQLLTDMKKFTVIQ